MPENMEKITFITDENESLTFFVEDDVEWEAVAKLFDQMLEDVDLQA